MRNILVLMATTSAIILSGLSPRAGLAEEVFRLANTFEVVNGSQFGTGSATSVSGGSFLGADIDTGKVTFGGIGDGLVGDRYGAEATIDFDARLGLQTGFEYGGGAVDLRLPYEVSLDLNESTTSNVVSLAPGFDIQSGSSFSTQAPFFAASAHLVVDVEASVKATACLFDCFLNNEEILPAPLRDFDASGLPGFSADAPLVGYDSRGNNFTAFGQTLPAGVGAFAAVPVSPPLSATARLGLITADGTEQKNADGDLLTVDDVRILGDAATIDAAKAFKVTAGVAVGLPASTLNDRGVSAGVGTDLANLTITPLGDAINSDLSGATATRFLAGEDAARNDQELVSLTLDIDALASLGGFPLPPGGGTFRVGPLFVGLDALDLELGGAIAIDQTLEFDANPLLRLDFDREVGVRMPGTAGECGNPGTLLCTVGRTSIAIDPADIGSIELTVDRELGVTPSFVLSPTLRNDVDLTLKPKTIVSALSGSVRLDGTELAAFGPLFSKDFTADVPPAKLDDLFDQVFGLDGTGRQAGALDRFVIAEGRTLPGQSTNDPLAATTRDGDTATYALDFATDIDRFERDLTAQVFSGPDRDYRTSTTSITSVVASGLELSRTTTTNLSRAGNGGSLFSDLDGPIAVSLSSAIPTKFNDVATSAVRAGPRFLGFETQIEDVTTTSFSDLLTQQTVQRSGGIGSDQALYLSFDLIERNLDGSYRENADGSYDFLSGVTFNVAGAPDASSLSYNDVVFDAPLRRDLYEDKFRIQAFESLSIDQGGDSPVGRLLRAIGDDDGLQLSISFGDGGIDDGGSGTNRFSYRFNPLASDCGPDFSLRAGNCDFNFADDFLFGEANLFGSTQFVDDELMFAHGLNSTTGIWEFTIDDFDVNVADVESLFDGLSMNEAVAALNLGVTFNDITRHDLTTETIPCNAFFCDSEVSQRTDIDESNGFSKKFVTGVDERLLTSFRPELTVIADGLTESRVSRRETPAPDAPEPPLPASPPDNPRPPPAPDVGQAGKCLLDASNPSRIDCDSDEPVVVSQTDPLTGDVTTTTFVKNALTEEATTTVTVMDGDTGEVQVTITTGGDAQEALASVLQQEPTPAGDIEVKTGADEPALPRGILASDPLTATTVTGNSYVFDFENVDGWGEQFRYEDLVFSSTALLADGVTPCSEGVGGLADGQIVAQAAAGSALTPTGIDRKENSLGDVAPCFVRRTNDQIFGQGAPAFLELPFAPVIDFDVDGPLFTSVWAPLFGGDNMLLTQDLWIELFDPLLDDFVRFDTLMLGGIYVFDEPVSEFRLSGIDISSFNLMTDGTQIDPTRSLVFGFTVTEPGTVITANVMAAVPAPHSSLLLAPLLLLVAQRRRMRSFVA